MSHARVDNVSRQMVLLIAADINSAETSTAIADAAIFFQTSDVVPQNGLPSFFRSFENDDGNSYIPLRTPDFFR